MKLAIGLCAVLLVSPIRASVAQSSDSASAAVLEPGTRVRVLATVVGKSRFVGTVASVRGDTVVLDTVDVTKTGRLFFPSTVPLERYRRISLTLAEIDDVEVSRGHSRARGLLKGTLGGALFGGVFVGLTAISGQGRMTLRHFAGGFTSGATAGLAVGAAAGFALRSERWASAQLPTRQGGGGLIAEGQH